MAPTDNLFSNPVLPGDFPDPSVIRVGSDYYSVHSTFQYFPAIPIMHSRDLVHWRFLGHALTRRSQLVLTGTPDSQGIWAPDISYHNGRYYIVYPVFRPGSDPTAISIHLVYADRPEGPYSEPVTLKHSTRGDCYIDPGLFFDDDGRAYLIWAGCYMQELTAELDGVLGETQQLWAGTGLPWGGEGPHLFQHNGYYYLTIAEGGTFYGHCQTMARARELWGPYEPCPYNPILHQPDPRAPIQKAGHGKIVETPEGEWWMLHLGGRPINGPYCPLGRETMLVPLCWTADGWPIVTGDRTPQPSYPRPALPPHPTCTREYSDDFSGPELGLQWEFIRNPRAGSWSLSEQPGALRLHGGAPLTALDEVSALLQRVSHFDCTATCAITSTQPTAGSETGLLLYLDTRHWVTLGRKGGAVVLTQNLDGVVTERAAWPTAADLLYYRVAATAQRYTFAVSPDNQHWTTLGPEIDGRHLSCDWVAERKESMCFTGVMVGVFAVGTGAVATVDWFRYQPE